MNIEVLPCREITALTDALISPCLLLLQSLFYKNSCVFSMLAPLKASWVTGKIAEATWENSARVLTHSVSALTSTIWSGNMDSIRAISVSVGTQKIHYSSSQTEWFSLNRLSEIFTQWINNSGSLYIKKIFKNNFKRIHAIIVYDTKIWHSLWHQKCCKQPKCLAVWDW